MKAGDLEPSFTCFLSTIDEGGAILPLDIAEDATVTFKMKSTLNQEVVVQSSMVVVDASRGKVRYYWISGDTDNPGSYAITVLYTTVDNRIRTFPGEGYHSFKIEPA